MLHLHASAPLEDEGRPRARLCVPRDGGICSCLLLNNYASSLKSLGRFEEAKSLLRKSIPVARRVLGVGHTVTLRLRWICAEALYLDTDATLDDLREAVAALEDVERTARRVFGGAHPLTGSIEGDVRKARAALRAREGA